LDFGCHRQHLFVCKFWRGIVAHPFTIPLNEFLNSMAWFMRENILNESGSFIIKPVLMDFVELD
jgi:hypothetical protein